MLGDRIRALRGSRSQSWLARQVGVTQVSVHAWENGNSKPTHRNLVLLAHVFGCSTDELLGVRPMRKRVRKARA